MLAQSARAFAGGVKVSWLYSNKNAARHGSRLRHIARARPWRPDPNDIDRLSKGDGARKRGTGNFNIPHRLNSEERPLYDGAKKKGFLAVKGSGYRKARKGYPLPNIYRQWCDAKGTPCVVIEQALTGGEADVVVVDLTPLRLMDLSEAQAACLQLAVQLGAEPVVERGLGEVPFNIIPVEVPLGAANQGTGGTASSAAAATAAAPAAPSAEQLSALQEALAAKGEEVRALKASGYTNQSPEVQFHVQGLTELKQQLASAQEAAAAAAAVDEAATSMAGEGAAGDTGDAAAMQGSSPKRRDVLPDDHPFATAAIWQLPATPLFFRAPRPVAKELAKQLASGFL